MKHNLCIIAVSILTISLHIYTMELMHETESDQLFIERTRALAQQKREIPKFCYQYINKAQHNNILHYAYSPDNKKFALITPVHRTCPDDPKFWENEKLLIFDNTEKLLYQETLANAWHDGVAVSDHENIFAILCNGVLKIKNFTTQKTETFIVSPPNQFPQPYIAFNRQETHIIVHDDTTALYKFFELTVNKITVNKNIDYNQYLERLEVNRSFNTYITLTK